MELTVWGIITALVVGLIVGALGRLVVPGRQNMPIWLHLLIGVGAALLGTVLARAIGIATETARYRLGRAAGAGRRSPRSLSRWWPVWVAAAASATVTPPVSHLPTRTTRSQHDATCRPAEVGRPAARRPTSADAERLVGPLRYGRHAPASPAPCRKGILRTMVRRRRLVPDGAREKWREQVEAAGSGHRRRGLGRDAARPAAAAPAMTKPADDSKLTVWMMGEGGDAQTAFLDGVETEFRPEAPRHRRGRAVHPVAGGAEEVPGGARRR